MRRSSATRASCARSSTARWSLIAVTLISLVLSVPAAYGLTRLVRGGGRPMLVGILAAQFFPPMVFFVPFYIMLQAVGPAEHAAGPDLRVPLGHASDLHLDGRHVAARHSGGDRGGRAHRRLRRLPRHLEHRPADRDAGMVTEVYLRLRSLVAGVHLRPALHDVGAGADRTGADVLPARPAPDRLRAADGGGRAPLDSLSPCPSRSSSATTAAG